MRPARRRRNVRLVAGGLAIALVAGVALTASLAPYDPVATDTAHVLEPPRRAHPFGTDDLGRDILSRVMHGARISLAVGLASVALAAGAGIPIGLPPATGAGWTTRSCA